MFVHMVAVHVVQMPLVKVIDVAAMLKGCMSATGSVAMLVVAMKLAGAHERVSKKWPRRRCWRSGFLPEDCPAPFALAEEIVQFLAAQ
jgi:hypothetical protein